MFSFYPTLRVFSSVPTVTSWTVARQAPLSMELFWQEYWSGLPFPLPGDPLNSEFKPTATALPREWLPLSHLGSPLPRTLAHKSQSVSAFFSYTYNTK